jgi:organic hydroperoxide reductase OsmC/OhrA
MLGTLNGALAARGIQLGGDEIRAAAEGVNELADGIVQLTAILIRYELRIPAGTRDAVDRALARHQQKCPTARSLEAAVAISWSAEIVETGAEASP